MNTFTEENYLKAIYHLSSKTESVGTNEIAAVLKTKAASVTDMLKKLADKKLINYARYQGVSLTSAGEKVALSIIRKHRLWEYFLVEKLNFKWDEVHDVAEELEHIASRELVDRLDDFMGNPKYDPHGDPIPDKQGKFKAHELKPVSAMNVDQEGVISGVRDHSAAFLQYLEKTKLTIGKKIKVADINSYDHSMILQTGDKRIHVSREAANNLLIAQ
ncbi:MAG: metal-dependent transcriptional regulator [Bacteroidetes bacterium]|nr:metal-dependent transcriptional regulator [Bacteroidota bacterium]